MMGHMALRMLLRPIDVRLSNRRAITRLLELHARPGFVVYDIGCGDKPFAQIVRSLGCGYIGVDVADGFYKEKPDLIGSATEVPAPDGVADIVISSEVVEHLEQPFEALREAHRLLKPNGVLLCSTPFLYPIHAAPNDFGRYTRFFFAAAARRLDYKIVAEKPLDGFWLVWGMNFAIYAQSFDRGLLKYTGLVPALIAMQQWFCVGMQKLESFGLRALGKKPDDFRQTWPLNYVFALAKNPKT